jgi:hypothetical protein
MKPKCLNKHSLYDTGPAGEIIYVSQALPLSCSVDKNYHRRYHETYDNASGYYGGDYSGHLGRYGDRGGFRDRASPAAHNDMRYTDMAPKYVLLRHESGGTYMPTNMIRYGVVERWLWVYGVTVVMCSSLNPSEFHHFP